MSTHESILFFIFLLFVILVYPQTSPTTPVTAPVSPPVTPYINKMKVMYYSPAAIGDDLSVFGADIYTIFNIDFHKQLLPVVTDMGATHILTNWLWDSCTNECHEPFLQLLQENNLQLLISLSPPSGGDEQFVIAKKALEIVVTELVTLSTQYSSVISGFVIFIPSTVSVDWTTYFSFINEMLTLIGTYERIVEFPLLSSGDPLIITDLTYVLASSWFVPLYSSTVVGANWITNVFEGFTSSFTSDTTTVMLFGMIYADSLNQSIAEISQSAQIDELFRDIYGSESSIALSQFRGTIMFELADEWWTADTASTGYDIEGCPSANSYAHNYCGENAGTGTVTVEYLGLFEIWAAPFQYCIQPKPSAFLVKYWWELISASTINIPANTFNITTGLPFVDISIMNGTNSFCIASSPWIPILPGAFPMSHVFVISPLIIMTSLIGGTLCCGPKSRSGKTVVREKKEGEDDKTKKEDDKTKKE